MSLKEYQDCDVRDPEYMDGEWFKLVDGTKIWIYNFKWWFIQQHLNSKVPCNCKVNFG